MMGRDGPCSISSSDGLWWHCPHPRSMKGTEQHASTTPTSKDRSLQLSGPPAKCRFLLEIPSGAIPN